MLELNKYSTNKIEDLNDICNEIVPTYIRKCRNIKDAILVTVK